MNIFIDIRIFSYTYIYLDVYAMYSSMTISNPARVLMMTTSASCACEKKQTYIFIDIHICSYGYIYRHTHI